jgi:hypothetical protein
MKNAEDSVELSTVTEVEPGELRLAFLPKAGFQSSAYSDSFNVESMLTGKYGSIPGLYAMQSTLFEVSAKFFTNGSEARVMEFLRTESVQQSDYSLSITYIQPTNAEGISWLL